MELFTRHPKYLELFTSCNRNWHLVAKKEMPTLWCGECPKCAFAFALLAAFVPKETIVRLFGKNLFEDEKLIPLYKELLGLEGIKPFECVGTPEETKAAFQLIHERGGFEGTPVLALLSDAKAKEFVDDAFKDSDEHAIPTSYFTLVA